MSTSEPPQPESGTQSAQVKPWTNGLVLLVVAAIANAGFISAYFINVDLDPVDSFVSELGANGEPFAWLFHGFDLVQGVSLFVSMLLLWNAFPRRVLVRVGQGCLLALAFLTAADSQLPLDCVPTADEMCRVRETLNLVSFAHATHSVTGVLESLLVNILFFVFAIALTKQTGWKFVGVFGWIAGFAYLGLSTLIAVQYMKEVGGLGITQRVQVLMFSAFLFAIAYAIYDTRLRNARARHSEPGRDKMTS